MIISSKEEGKIKEMLKKVNVAKILEKSEMEKIRERI